LIKIFVLNKIRAYSDFRKIVLFFKLFHLSWMTTLHMLVYLTARS